MTDNQPRYTTKRLQDEIAKARAYARIDALEEAATLIDEGFDRPGIAKKQDKCPHNKFEWEDCEGCAADAIRGLKLTGDAPPPSPHVVAPNRISLREAAQDLLKAQKTGPLQIGYRLDLWAALEACLTATATDTTQLQHVISITQHPNVESPKQEQTSTELARKGNGAKNHKQH